MTLAPVTAVSAARSLLFVPGDRPERFGKALAAGADAVIVDLEDAVPAEAKTRALTATIDWLAGAGTAVVRLSDDPALIRALAAAGGLGLTGVMVPKAEDAGAIESVRALFGPTVPVIALVETAIGVARVDELARSGAVDRVALGSFDLSLDLGIAEDSELMAAVRLRLVLASRLAGLPAPIDTVTAEIGDGSAAGAAARRSRANGFGGKLCIHPVQLAAVNAAFGASEEELAWAREVVAAAETGAAVRVDGRMVDRPIIERARRLLRTELTQ